MNFHARTEFKRIVYTNRKIGGGKPTFNWLAINEVSLKIAQLNILL